MSNILKEILKKLPEGKISEATFEGANIVLYSKDMDFVLNNNSMIKEVVHEFKKRVELRPDPAILADMDAAEKIIRDLMPEDAGVGDILFEEQRSIVILEVDKPGIAIGKGGENLIKIKKETGWVATVKRNAAIRSKILENIRSVLYQNSAERRKFLHKVGERIYNGWIREKKKQWIRATYLGAARQVGRSSILLQTPESRVLLDCGIDVSTEIDPYPHLEAPEFKIQELDAIILSHAHADHCALIPLLIKYGYDGPIYCTAPTRDIAALMMLDVVKIMKSSGKNPIYEQDEVKQFVKQCILLDFESVTDVTPDVRLTFYNAGHMLGAAMTHLNIGNGYHNLLYTADMKFAKSNVLSAAVCKFPRLETLMIESTYGGRDKNMPPAAEQEKQFRELVIKTVERKGKLLLPVLGSGRAQEMLVLIVDMMKRKEIPQLPIYVHGLVWDITALHTAYPEFMNSTIRKQIFHKDENPFLYEKIQQVGSNKEKEEIVASPDPCIIVATSGMMIGGASVEYFKGLAEQKKNTLIFSSYLSPSSLGRRIFDGAHEVAFQKGMGQDIVKVNMEVAKIDITGHSDRRELMNFVNRCSPRPKKIILNHGENSQIMDLASALHRQFKVEVNAPRNLEAVRLR